MYSDPSLLSKAVGRSVALLPTDADFQGIAGGGVNALQPLVGIIKTFIELRKVEQVIGFAVHEVDHLRVRRFIQPEAEIPEGSPVVFLRWVHGLDCRIFECPLVTDLELIFLGIVYTRDDPTADAEDHRAVAADKRFKSRFVPLVDEGCQKLSIRAVCPILPQYGLAQIPSPYLLSVTCGCRPLPFIAPPVPGLYTFSRLFRILTRCMAEVPRVILIE
jgi:hypothetical protein